MRFMLLSENTRNIMVPYHSHRYTGYKSCRHNENIEIDLIYLNKDNTYFIEDIFNGLSIYSLKEANELVLQKFMQCYLLIQIIAN